MTNSNLVRRERVRFSKLTIVTDKFIILLELSALIFITLASILYSLPDTQCQNLGIDSLSSPSV